MTLRKFVRLVVVVSLLFGSVVATASTGGAVQQHGEHPLRLKAGEVTPDRSAEVRADLNRNGRGYYLVQFDGPIFKGQTDALVATGAELMAYVPDFAYKVRMRPNAVEAATAVDGVTFVGGFEAEYKLSPNLIEGEGLFTISVERGVDRSAVEADIAASGFDVVSSSGRVITVLGAGADLDGIAAIADVAWIENFQLREKHNEYGAGVIVGANAANALGYDGSTQIVAVADTGLGDGTAAGAHPDISASRIVDIQDWPGADSPNCYNVIPDGAQDVESGHGTHVSLSVLGDGTGTGLGKGTAPAAGLVFQAVEDYADMVGFCALINPDGYYLLGLPDDLGDLLQAAYNQGARIHSDSWGSDAAGDYTADAAAVDDFTWNNPDFLMTTSAGNSGVDNNNNGVVDNDSTGSPATAKNLLTVGASENERPDNFPCDTSLTYVSNDAYQAGETCSSMGGVNELGTAGQRWGFNAEPLFSDVTAGNAEQMAPFSSRGPTDDGRIKPDVVAPGTWILSGFSGLYQQGYGTTTNPQNGAFQYDGWGMPINPQYKYMGGTSMSNPITAGAAAVVKDYYVKAHSHDASAALTKASLINSAVDLLDENNDGADDNDFPIPNVHEGWGRIDVANAVDGTAQWDDKTTGLTTGGSTVYSYTTDGTTDLKVTLVWSDFPSTAAASVNLVNDLDLVVSGPGGTFNGNVFSNGWSTTGGSADRVNNVENVYIQNAAAGTWTVTVSGFNVPMGPQPFALVVDGTGTAGPQPPVASFTSSCADLTCDFTDTSTDSDGDVVGWSWDFGDSSPTSTEQNPTYTYAAAGMYDVTLTVTDNDGSTDSATNQVTVTDPTVNNPPTASFTSSCPNLTCAFTDTSTDSDGTIVAWSWSFGDGAGSTAQNPSHTYAAAGTYTVSLTVTDDDGATDSSTGSVTVTASPAAMHVGDLDGSSIDNNRRWHAVATIQVHDAAEAPVSGALVEGSWSAGTTGSGSCTTDATGSCQIQRNNIRDNVASVTFTVDNVTLAGVAYDAAANHDPDGGDSDGTVLVVNQISGIPTASFTSSCTQLQCTFTDTSTDSDGSVESWSWDFGDGNTSTVQHPVHTYVASGTYTVTLTVTDDAGNTDTTTNDVTVSDGTGGGTIHVGDLDPSSTANGTRRWNAIVTITVHDSAEQPVSGATVDGSWSSGTSGSGSCVTGAAGTCQIERSNIRNSSTSVTFTVDGITLAGFTYDAAANHDPDGGNGTTITVSSP